MSSAGFPPPVFPERALPLISRWILPQAASAAAADLARQAGLPLLVAGLLVERGVESAEQAARFLDPHIDHLLDPYTMQGMRSAVARVQTAIERHESILIYGDYDVDGTLAIVLLKQAIEMLGGDVRFHVPHRIRDGYGMQEDIVSLAASEGVRLVISVDNGIRAFAAAEAAARLGIDLIVTDHHLPEASPEGNPILPSALAILNPNQDACAYLCKHLCGAGVAFKLSQALLEASDAERARKKILPSFLKMLAIATVADAVPLLGENRVFASIGLEQLRHPVNAGLRALIELARLDPAQHLTATDIAFRIAPRLNAAGRMDVASDVIELFSTRDPHKAREIAEKLDRLNSERRQVEASVLAEIERRLAEDECFQQSRSIVIDGAGWHRGILGILASRIVDRANRPALVIARDRDEAHGSGRSVPGFHLLRALESCHDLFLRFGGHAHAVGFSLPAERIPELRRRLEAWTVLHLKEAVPTLRCHAILPLDQITGTLRGWLRRLEPLGMGNEEPIFLACDVRLASPVHIMRGRHVRLRLTQGTHAANFSAIGWNWADRIQSLALKEGSMVHLAYRLRERQNPDFASLELEIADLALAP